ncbi:hypothetical protein B1no1_08440 [Thermolongibacillus altinsuensis]|nr:hypothetical protein B1no1_08440 [Thermolongibacillus altinsuensis]
MGEKGESAKHIVTGRIYQEMEQILLAAKTFRSSHVFLQRNGSVRNVQKI